MQDRWIAKAAERSAETPAGSLKQHRKEKYEREDQISDIPRFWVNDVTLMKVAKIANRKFLDLLQICR
jgi:hypothetical protein